MLTMIGIAAAAVFIFRRWYLLHKSKKAGLTLERVDAEFMKLLNRGDAHGK